MKEKIKILILKISMPLGGAETLILQHLQNLNRETFQIHLGTLRSDGLLLSEAMNYADKYTCLDKKMSIDPFSLYKLRRYIVSNNIDIVHCHDYISAIYVYLSTKGVKIKKVVTIHSQEKSWRNNISLFIIKRFDKIVTVSRNQKLNFFENEIPWNNMKVIYNCYDTAKFGPLDYKKHIKHDDVFRIVMVGNFYWQKDHKTLIEAVNIVRNQGFKIELHLVGGRNKVIFEQNQKLIQKLNLLSIVCFHTDKRVDSSFLSKFDLFVFSTKSERLPIAPLEAMACSLPVLVSDIAPNMELIRYGHDGFYFETANIIDCADKIMTIIKNPQNLQQKKEYGYSRVKEFTPDIVVRNLERFYKSILEMDNTFNKH